MNLENLNVQEMSTKEMKSTDGGLLGLIVAGVIVVALILWPKEAK